MISYKQIRVIKAKNYIPKHSQGITYDQLNCMVDSKKKSGVIRLREVEGYVEGKLKTPFFEVGGGLRAKVDRS